MGSAIRSIRCLLARLPARLALVAVLLGLVRRAFNYLRSQQRHAVAERLTSRRTLPSLLDRYPNAMRAPRRMLGVRSVPIDRIVGTVRHPSQNTADFLPLPFLRGENWRARWQRIDRATSRLETLPPVELVQVGDEYFVADGHNRVAAARQAGAVEIDADVTQLLVPGVQAPAAPHVDAAALVGSDSVRRAGQGRMSRTVPQRPAADMISREDLIRDEPHEHGGDG